MPRIYAKDNVTTAKPDMITATDVGTKRALDVNIADGDVVVGNTTPIDVVNVPDRRVTTIIDDDTFDATVTGADIDMTGYRNGLLTISLGAMTGTPTMTPSVEVKDSNGNYIPYDTLPVMNAGNTSVSWSFYDLPDTVRVVCTLGSTTSFADVTVEWTAMN